MAKPNRKETVGGRDENATLGGSFGATPAGEPGGPPRTPKGKITPMRIGYGVAILSALVAALLSCTLAPILFIELGEWLGSLVGGSGWGPETYEDYFSLACGLVGVPIMAVVTFPLCLAGVGLGYDIEGRFRGERASGLGASIGALVGGFVAFVVGIVLLFFWYLGAYFAS